MAITLEWIRDHYDTNKTRHIEGAEGSMASFDFAHGTITQEQLDAVNDAWKNYTLLPDYGDEQIYIAMEHVTSINIPSGAMLKVNGVEVI